MNIQIDNGTGEEIICGKERQSVSSPKEGGGGKTRNTMLHSLGKRYFENNISCTVDLLVHQTKI